MVGRVVDVVDDEGVGVEVLMEIGIDLFWVGVVYEVDFDYGVGDVCFVYVEEICVVIFVVIVVCWWGVGGWGCLWCLVFGGFGGK